MSRQNSQSFVPRRMGTAYAPDAEGGAEGDYGFPGMRGLREDDARVKLGTAYYPSSEGEAEGDYAYPVRAQAVHMGESAEAPDGPCDEMPSRMRGGQPSMMISDGRVGSQSHKDFSKEILENREYVVSGLREDDARVKLGTAYAPAAEGESEGDYAYPVRERAVHGLREDDARITMRGLREDDARIMLKGLREDDAMVLLKGLREDDASLVLKGLREDDAHLVLKGLREDDAAILMKGLREDDAAIHMAELGRKRGRKTFRKYGATQVAPGYTAYRAAKEMKGLVTFMGAEDFHPRFEVEARIEGLGVIHGQAVDGIFDIFKGGPSAEEYMGKLNVIAAQWGRVRPRLDALATEAQAAIRKTMSAADAPYEDYVNTVPIYIQEGYAGYQAHNGRWNRVKRYESYLPTIDKLVSQAETLGGMSHTQAVDTAKKDVDQRIDEAKKPNILTDIVLPVGAVTLGLGVITYASIKMFG